MLDFTDPFHEVVEELPANFDDFSIFASLRSRDGYCDFLFRNGRNVNAWPLFYKGLSEVEEIVIPSPDLEIPDLITTRYQVSVELTSTGFRVCDFDVGDLCVRTTTYEGRIFSAVLGEVSY